MTYSEKEGKGFFDWSAFLNKEAYSANELREAIRLAGSWVTCACGNQCEAIPRETDGTPVDKRLNDLGLRFFWNVKSIAFSNSRNSVALMGFRKRGKELLKDIEERSAQIIQELKN